MRFVGVIYPQPPEMKHKVLNLTHNEVQSKQFGKKSTRNEFKLNDAILVSLKVQETQFSCMYFVSTQLSCTKLINSKGFLIPIPTC